MRALERQPNLIEVEQTLSKHDYFSRSPLPGFADGVIFKLLTQNKKYPLKQDYPNFYHWYIIMCQFSSRSIQAWIKDKLYSNEQSERCIFLISDIFLNSPDFALQTKNRKKSLDHLNPEKRDKNLAQSLRFKPIDTNSEEQKSQKAQYTMIVQIKVTQNLEELSNKFYRLKIKIKELKYHKKQKSVFMRFVTQTNLLEEAKQQILKWNEVTHVTCKLSKYLKQEKLDKRKLMRTISIR